MAAGCMRFYGRIYKLAEDISGIGFKLADEIAGKAGIMPDSDFRIKAGLLYMLAQSTAAGHIYIPTELLLRKTAQMLLIEPERMERHLTELSMDKSYYKRKRGRADYL